MQSNRLDGLVEVTGGNGFDHCRVKPDLKMRI